MAKINKPEAETFWRVETDGMTQRSLNLTRQREQKRQEMEHIREKTKKENQVSMGGIDKKFDKKNQSAMDALFTDITTGLKTKDDYIKNKETLATIMTRETELLQEHRDKAKLKERRKRKAEVAMLSFGAEEEEEEPPAKVQKVDEESSAKRVGKDPSVNTSFLPDKEREELDRKERDRLKQEWIEIQEAVKQDTVKIPFSYYDGKGHRNQVEIEKGFSIRQFLERAQREVREISRLSVDNLMFVKEDLVIPQHFTFYDLMVTKARGKSGPLFTFDVIEDIRSINNAQLAKFESHCAKVVEKKWYERNKHIFPASRWENYDPQKEYGEYKIGSKKRRK